MRKRSNLPYGCFTLDDDRIAREREADRGASVAGRSPPLTGHAMPWLSAKYQICGTCDSSRRGSFAQQALSAFGGGSTGNHGAGCFSSTLGKEMPDNACVQSKSDGLWYQCANGSWVDRWTDPDACNGVHPL